ncbi:MAG TPA: UbiA family prenyltransferase [Gemmatimonadales bacterium]|nr:UbiA family prenyltransferase [Gemmatimonadales bacterium]
MNPIAPVIRGCGRAWARFLALDRVIRVHFLFFSSFLPLLGGSTARRDLDPAQILALLGVGLCFHLYSYVLNDVCDLPVDRTHPARQNDPLVRGTLRTWQALLIALVPVPLTVPLTVWLGGGARAYAMLGAGFALMAVYNLWGKRCPIPPLTDAAQGLAWGSLALYGCLAIGGDPNVLTWLVTLYGAGFLLHINGIHGGLRDLENDLASGARTTAIYLGARPRPGGEVHVPSGVSVFAYSVLVGLAAMLLVPLLRNDFGYEPGVWTAMLAIAGSLLFVDLLLLAIVMRPNRPRWNVVFRVHCFSVAAVLPITFAPFLSAETLAALLLVLVLSFLPLEWARWLRPAYPSPTERNAAQRPAPQEIAAE